MSDWERRPLSDKQVEYAAMDAFVLLDIYDVIADPEKGLSQQQLQSLTYNYIGQKRHSSGPTSSDNTPDQPTSLADYVDINTASKYPHSGPKLPAGPADEQQPAATADSGTQATIGSSRQLPGLADSRQPDSNQHNSVEEDNSDDDSNRRDGPGGSVPLQHLHQQQTEQSRMQHDGPGGFVPFQHLHQLRAESVQQMPQQQTEQSRMQHDATASLPAGSPLLGCLQRNKLQHVVNRIAPGTG